MLAEHLETVSTQIRALNSRWSGESQQAFALRGEHWRQVLEHMQTTLEAAHAAATRAGERLIQAEQQAVALWR